MDKKKQVLAALLFLLVTLVFLIPGDLGTLSKSSTPIQPLSDRHLQLQPAVGDSRIDTVSSTNSVITKLPLPEEAVMIPDDTAKTASLNGWIGDDLGLPVESQVIELRPITPGSLNYDHYFAFSDSRGEFEFADIRANANYRLEVAESKQYRRLVVDLIKLGGQNDHVSLTLEPWKLVNLLGRVVNTDLEPVANLNLNIQNIDSSQEIVRVSTDSSGFFNLTRFPAGVLKVTTSAPDYFKIVGARLSLDEFQNMTFTIDKSNQYLSGWVVDESGSAVANARITLDGEFGSKDVRSFSLRTRITDLAGTFAFERIGELDYVITVYAVGFRKKELNYNGGGATNSIQIALSRAK